MVGNIVGEQKRKGSHRSAAPCLGWRDSTRRALALVFIFIFQNSHPRPIVPLNTLCRMRRLAYNVAALQPPSELVIARWQRARSSQCSPRPSCCPNAYRDKRNLPQILIRLMDYALSVAERCRTVANAALAAVENVLASYAYTLFPLKSHHWSCWRWFKQGRSNLWLNLSGTN